MNDLFDFSTNDEKPKISQSEFNALAKKLLNSIYNSYHQSWHSRPLRDDEFPDESICDKCTGCGTFKVDDEDKECFKDREQGQCYHTYRDAEEFGIEVETEFEKIHYILGSEIISSVNESKQDGGEVDDIKNKLNDACKHEWIRSFGGFKCCKCGQWAKSGIDNL